MACEFACPYCRKAWDTVEDLRKKYGDGSARRLQVIHRPSAQVATIAGARCAAPAHHQGKFREMAELLWTKAFDAREFDQAEHRRDREGSASST